MYLSAKWLFGKSPWGQWLSQMFSFGGNQPRDPQKHPHFPWKKILREWLGAIGASVIFPLTTEVKLALEMRLCPSRDVKASVLPILVYIHVGGLRKSIICPAQPLYACPSQPSELLSLNKSSQFSPVLNKKQFYTMFSKDFIVKTEFFSETSNTNLFI